MSANRDKLNKMNAWAWVALVAVWVPLIWVNLGCKQPREKGCEPKKTQTGMADSVRVNKNDSVQSKNRTMYYDYIKRQAVKGR